MPVLQRIMTRRYRSLLLAICLASAWLFGCSSNLPSSADATIAADTGTGNPDAASLADVETPQPDVDAQQPDAATDPCEGVPALHTELCIELRSELNRFAATLPTPAAAAPTLIATELVTANSNAGPLLLEANYRAGNLQYLGALAGLGAEAVVITVSYPLFTPAFHGSIGSDINGYLAFYRETAAAARARGLKVIVKHNTLFSALSALPTGAYYATRTKQTFGIERYQEVLRIIDELAPDYLSLLTEPDVNAGNVGLDFSESEWVSYVERIVAQLATDRPASPCLLGAGAGTWSSIDLPLRFAAIAGLDYINLHIYPVAGPGGSYLQRLIDWPRQIRAVAPSKAIVLTEAWLYKATVAEHGGNPTLPIAFARDVYEHWAPLDGLYLSLLIRAARSESYAVVSPFWSRYLFAYLPFDSVMGQLPFPEANTLANQAAGRAVAAGQISQTGRTFRALASE